MTAKDILYILPLIIPALAVILSMILIAVLRNHLLIVIATLASLLVALMMVFVAYKQKPEQITHLIVMDRYACFYIILLYTASMAVCALSYGYLKHKKVIREEYYLFLLTTALGSAILVSSNHFASLFIGIELISLSLYVLIAYTGTRLNIEAGIKYFIMTAVSVAFLLFGISLIYAARGSMKFPSVTDGTFTLTTIHNPLYLIGIILFLVGIGFKLALVPFHYWIADVFEGAPAPIAGFLGTVSKGAVLAVMIRYFAHMNIMNQNALYYIFAAVAVASMFFGNIVALTQVNIKRFLGYSSIAHFGYLLVMLIAGSLIAITAASFYLTAYIITQLIAFGIITFLSKGITDLETLEDYRGLAFTHPAYSASLSIAMLSLAGIPLTAGFIAKFYIITAGANVKLWPLLIVLVINSIIGLFYYLKIIVTLYSRPSTENSFDKNTEVFGPSFSLLGALAVAVLLFFIIYLGINPAHLMHLIENLIVIKGG